MTLIFLKRLNDTLEENAEKLIKDGKSEKEALPSAFQMEFGKEYDNNQ